MDGTDIFYSDQFPGHVVLDPLAPKKNEEQKIVSDSIDFECIHVARKQIAIRADYLMEATGERQKQINASLNAFALLQMDHTFHKWLKSKKRKPVRYAIDIGWSSWKFKLHTVMSVVWGWTNANLAPEHRPEAIAEAKTLEGRYMRDFIGNTSYPYYKSMLGLYRREFWGDAKFPEKGNINEEPIGFYAAFAKVKN